MSDILELIHQTSGTRLDHWCTHPDYRKAMADAMDAYAEDKAGGRVMLIDETVVHEPQGYVQVHRIYAPDVDAIEVEDGKES